MKQIIEELNLENGSNHKIAVLKKHQDNKLLQKLLKMTYCKVNYTYGITLKNIPDYTPSEDRDLGWALEQLELLADRTFTGNAAIDHLHGILSKLSTHDADIIEKVIKRDLRINMGRSNINKVFKNLVVRPPYMRCGIYTEKTSQKILFPAYIQIKADGRYTSVEVLDGKVEFISRSGEEKEFPILLEYFKDKENGIYIGELLVRGMSNRSLSNGNINSSEPDHKNIYIQLWDFITWDEWSRPKDKSNKIFYVDRLKKLESIITKCDNAEIITTYEVNNKKEALQYVGTWMEEGLEGGILKDFKNIFIDHTSPTQLKLKLEISLEMRVIGFIEGTPGTKRAETFGSILFENDEGTIKGSTSGFTDEQLIEINNNRENWIGKIIEVQCNDIIKARNSETYSLSHPRFIADRSDEKNTTDTLEKAMLNREMSMSI